jgi:FADH2 O2-dependent halogenase
MNEKADTDVAIIGGGPAGSSMAAYLAKAGVKCTVFEGELFPRPHVGESLVPSSTRVFSELDFLTTMEARRFPHKYGAAWTASNSAKVYEHGFDGLGEATIRFSEREQPGVMKDYTYHVDRGEFDNALLQHAHGFGAAVHEGVRVQRVDFEDGRLPRVNYTIGGKELSSTAQIVVDASGRRTLLGSQLKLRTKDPVFDQYAIHTWFSDYDRNAWAKSEQHKNFIFVHFLPISNSWVWQIPINDDVTSIGVVTQRKHFAKSKTSREAFFWECVDSRPEVGQKLRAARQVRPFTDEGNYSYAMSQITGDRWVMVGDAGRFVDPIFSTGVSIALNSSRFAHRDVLKALETGNFQRSVFDDYETTIRRGTNNWYKFISVYYRLNVLFTYFITEPKYRLDVLKLLQGDVYDAEEPEVLKQMRNMVLDVENDRTHPWHKLLNDMTAEAFKPLF